MIEHPGLVFSAEAGRLTACVSPSEERPPLDHDSLRNLLTQAGYGGWFLFEEALNKLVELYPISSTELKLPLGECRDASFTLEIAADELQVWINVVPACGGKSPDPDEIYRLLEEAGVVFGIERAAVSAACAATTAERVLVASGQAAVNGENARFELLISDARDRAPQVDENGLIDFRELGAIPTVAAEQALMRRIPPTTGTAGRNIRGAPIEPVPGRDEVFADKLIGAYVARDDANLLRAVFAGQPVRCGNGVNIEQVLSVRNVDMTSGNISFNGTVKVDGEVLPGMKVRATGDIIVSGVVEGAELDADGDVHVGGGIIAKASVRAGGSVSARFVENASVSAGITIAINDAALQSNLQANNQILVGLKSPQRGRLAGGSARAMMLICAPILGSATSGVTSLLLGVNPVLEAQYQALLKRIDKQREDESNLEKLVKHLEKLGDKAGVLARAKASWQLALQAWAKLLPEREALEKQLALVAEAKIEVSVAVAGAVDMTFGKKMSRLRRNYDAGAFSIDGDQLVFADSGGNVNVISAS